MIITLIALFILFLLFLVGLHIGFRAPRIKETTTPQDTGLDFTEVSIPTVNNKKLYGWLILADSSQHILVILHGWGSNAEHMLPLATPFQRAGVNVLLIDARNHGKSDADTFSSLPRFAEDLGASIDWIKQNHPKLSQKIAVLGHSLGASAAIYEASKRNDIHAAISISAFAHPEWLMQRFLGNLNWKRLRIPQPVIHFILKYIQWIIGHTFTSIAPVHTICNTGIPILLVHGKDDVIVPVEDAQAIIKHCPKPHIQLLEIANAGHDSVDKIEEHSKELVDFLLSTLNAPCD